MGLDEERLRLDAQAVECVTELLGGLLLQSLRPWAPRGGGQCDGCLVHRLLPFCLEVSGCVQGSPGAIPAEDLKGS